jgi:hypothetical protein
MRFVSRFSVGPMSHSLSFGFEETSKSSIRHRFNVPGTFCTLKISSVLLKGDDQLLSN